MLRLRRILMHIEFYSGIVQFLCHSMAFLYTLVSDHSNADITHSMHCMLIFMAVVHSYEVTAMAENHGTRPK